MRLSAHSPEHPENQDVPQYRQTNTAVPSNIPWHTLEIEAVIGHTQADISSGLSSSEAQRRLEEYGRNAIAITASRSTLSIFIRQFTSLIVGLLIAATVVAFALGDHLEAVAILIVIVINAVIGFLTEWKAEQTLTALQKQTVPLAHVIRDGTESQIDAEELVPGDLVVLAAGAKVPADGRLIEDAQLQIEEAALTGESHSVTKSSQAQVPHDAALGDRLNLTFMGTTITDGRGKMIVTGTGVRSEMGKIGDLIDRATFRQTPLEQKLEKLGRLLIILVLSLCAIIVFFGSMRGNDFLYMIEIGISLAIAAVPEGLPAVSTITLALGMQRMARMKALVRRLPAVETLGSTTIICTDKTGTLTRNEMTASVLILDDRRIQITGTGYSTEGFFEENGERLKPQADKHLTLALQIGALCNDAKVLHEGDQNGGEETILGDPTEAALIVAAAKAGLSESGMNLARISEIPFDSTTKRMVTVNRSSSGKNVAFVKGSPSALYKISRAEYTSNGEVEFTQEVRKKWEAANRTLASSALRVLAFAYRELPEQFSEADLTKDLTFVGLVGMSDPLREEAKEAIATCREAGIRSIMITGDQQLTAAEIARQLGLDQDLDGHAMKTVHARELSGLDQAGWQQTVNEASVFARVSPKHKLQIVEALQQQGQIVAMTGDGVNDAPALKQADIGIAMGIKGTEVAKETSDMVITDDNFATIVRAVEQGRIIYANIVRFIHYLFSCNFAEITTVFVAIMIGWPLPLAPLQILWLNMVTDIFPALALALQPSAPDMMKRPPRDPKETLLPPRFIILIVWQGTLLAAVSLAAFYIGLQKYGFDGDGVQHAGTLAFMTLAAAQIFHALSVRSQRHSLFTKQSLNNAWLWGAIALCLLLQLAAVFVPILQQTLDIVPPDNTDWLIIITFALVPMILVEIGKLIHKSYRSHSKSRIRLQMIL